MSKSTLRGSVVVLTLRLVVIRVLNNIHFKTLDYRIWVAFPAIAIRVVLVSDHLPEFCISDCYIDRSIK